MLSQKQKEECAKELVEEIDKFLRWEAVYGRYVDVKQNIYLMQMLDAEIFSDDPYVTNILDEDPFKKKILRITFNVMMPNILDEFPNGLLVEGYEGTTKEICEQGSSRNANKNSAKKDDTKKNSAKKDDAIKNDSRKRVSSEISEQSDSLETILEDIGICTDVTSKQNKCLHCGVFDKLQEDNGVIICISCGAINKSTVDFSPEWRQYEDGKEGVNRCSCPTNFFFPKSSRGTIITGSANLRIKRKQQWGQMPYKERSLNSVLETIEKVCGTNKIPKNITDTAKTLYKRISDCCYKVGNNTGKQIIIRGDNRKNIIAACVYKSCEINKDPLTSKTIAKMFNTTEKKINEGINSFEETMEKYDNNYSMELSHSVKPSDFIKKHCAALDFSSEDTALALRIAKNCAKLKLATDHSTRSLAAGSILLMIDQTGSTKDRKEITKIFETSDVTISKIYNKISPYVDVLSNDELTKEIGHKYGLI